MTGYTFNDTYKGTTTACCPVCLSRREVFHTKDGHVVVRDKKNYDSHYCCSETCKVIYFGRVVRYIYQPGNYDYISSAYSGFAKMFYREIKSDKVNPHRPFVMRLVKSLTNRGTD
jgi:hypothetical protein